MIPTPMTRLLWLIQTRFWVFRQREKRNIMKKKKKNRKKIFQNVILLHFYPVCSALSTSGCLWAYQNQRALTGSKRQEQYTWTRSSPILVLWIEQTNGLVTKRNILGFSAILMSTLNILLFYRRSKRHPYIILIRVLTWRYDYPSVARTTHI